MTDTILTARIHREDGRYWAEVVELPGCFASGDNEAELLESLHEAIAMCLEPDADASAKPVSVPTQVTFSVSRANALPV